MARRRMPGQPMSWALPISPAFASSVSIVHGMDGQPHVPRAIALHADRRGQMAAVWHQCGDERAQNTAPRPSRPTPSSPTIRRCAQTRCARRFARMPSYVTRPSSGRRGLSHGTRHRCGLGIENTKGAMFWMTRVDDRKTHGVNDIPIAITDELKHMSEALVAVFASTTLTASSTSTATASTGPVGKFANPGPLRAAVTRPMYTAPPRRVPGWHTPRSVHLPKDPAGQKFSSACASWHRARDCEVLLFAPPPGPREKF